MNRTSVKPQKVQIHRDKITTLNDFQRLLGEINWIRPKLGIPTYALQHLLASLKEDPNLNSPRTLSKEALKEL